MKREPGPIAALIILILTTLMLSACGQPVAEPENRTINRQWAARLTPQIVDLSMVDYSGATASMILVTHYNSAENKTTCWMTAFFRGDAKSGTITLENPGLLVVKPMGRDGSPCYWIADVTGYQVVGTQLTLTLDGGQSPLTFQ